MNDGLLMWKINTYISKYAIQFLKKMSTMLQRHLRGKKNPTSQGAYKMVLKFITPKEMLIKITINII